MATATGRKETATATGAAAAPDMSTGAAAAPPDVSDASKADASSAKQEDPKKFLEMTAEEVKAWVERSARQGEKNRYAGLERALREQLIAEGVLPPTALWEDVKEDVSSTIQLCIEEEFERKFTEAALGLALNVGKRGTIIVKRCVPGSPSFSRRIPPGVILTHVNETKLEFPSLKEVQTMLQQAERPVTLKFQQTEASLAIAHQSVRAVAHERDEHNRKVEEAKAQFAEEMETVEIETAEVFTRTYTEARLGLCLFDATQEVNGQKLRRTQVAKCLPRSPSWKSGLPAHVYITAINGKSVEFRRFKEVKKLIELAQRPVTLSFSMEEDPVFPVSAKKAASAVPAYARRPV